MAIIPDLNHELAALAAAVCWALTGILAAAPAGHLGAIAFNRVRQVTVTLLLALYVLASGTWRDLSPDVVAPLVLSGLIGIFVGDTLLFTALNRIGPRRAGILFALNAPMSALLGWIFLGETLPPLALVGIALTCAGVMLAILFGKRPGQSARLESVKGPLWIGVALGLGAALGQSLGSIIARPVMAAGVDPFAASMLRVGVAAAGIFSTWKPSALHSDTRLSPTTTAAIPSGAIRANRSRDDLPTSSVRVKTVPVVAASRSAPSTSRMAESPTV